jgi:hypothetical protein
MSGAADYFRTLNEVCELVKQGHKYLERRPLPGGGYEYVYQHPVGAPMRPVKTGKLGVMEFMRFWGEATADQQAEMKRRLQRKDPKAVFQLLDDVVHTGIAERAMQPSAAKELDGALDVFKALAQDLAGESMDIKQAEQIMRARLAKQGAAFTSPGHAPKQHPPMPVGGAGGSTKPGTTHRWADGMYQKQPNGSWTKLPEGHPDASKPAVMGHAATFPKSAHVARRMAIAAHTYHPNTPADRVAHLYELAQHLSTQEGEPQSIRDKQSLEEFKRARQRWLDTGAGAAPADSVDHGEADALRRLGGGD